MASVWSREYVREILNRVEPMEAVYSLSEIWSSRQGRSASDPCFGLLPCEYNVHLYLNYRGDVGNGGHAQFFLNPVGAYTSETLNALIELGFAEIHGILTRAAAVFPDSRVPKDWQERERLIQNFPKSVFSLWGRLDKALYAIDGAHWKPLLKYLRDHQSEILEKECS
jgi:hypothetical protein